MVGERAPSFQIREVPHMSVVARSATEPSPEDPEPPPWQEAGLSPIAEDQLPPSLAQRATPLQERLERLEAGDLVQPDDLESSKPTPLHPTAYARPLMGRPVGRPDPDGGPGFARETLE